MSSLLERLKKNSTIKEAAILNESMVFKKEELVTTDIPLLNVAQSGSLDGGFGPGLTLWCGNSKHFKTLFLLMNVKAYLDKYRDAVCLFYDSEFGAPQSYFESVGIDPSRVLHIPIVNMEELKFDLTKQMDEIKRGDRIFIAVDSVGNLASKKEAEDALEGKSVADMTRAKQMKSIFRIITPHLTLKNIPMHVVNHIYMEQGMFPKAIVSGGTGIYLSADNIYIIGRQQLKEGTDISGYNFIINVEKSRHVKEKSKIPITVTHAGGIKKWSGMLDLACELGFVTKPKQGWYTRPTVEGDKLWRAKDADTDEFWQPILSGTNFEEAIEKTFKTATVKMVQDGNFIGDDYDEE